MTARAAPEAAPPTGLPVIVRAVQLAGLLALTVVLLPGTDAVGDAVRDAVPALVLGGTAVLFADAAARGGGRRPLAAARWLLAAAFTAWAALAAWTATTIDPAGWLIVVLAAAGTVAVLAATAAEMPRGGPRWLPSAGLGGGVVAAAVAGLVIAGYGAAVDAADRLLVGAGASGGAERDGGENSGIDLFSNAGALVALLDGALLVALLAAITVVGPTAHPHLRWLAGGMAGVVVADGLALASTGTAALLAVPAAVSGVGIAAGTTAGGGVSGATACAQLLAVGGYAAAGLAASDDVLGRRADRRFWVAGTGLPFTAEGLLLSACFALVAVSLLDPDVSRIGAGLALVALALALSRTTAALRFTQRLNRTDPPPRTDDLTGLANRRALSEALAGDRSPDDDDTGWSGWAGWADEIALLLVDLDRFKDINEALGHDAGDRLLTAVGARLRTALRPTQMLARLGGDEFAVVLPAAGPGQARRVAEALQASLDEAFDVDGARLHVQASVGIATAHPSRGGQTDLLRQADVAMYQAKATGSGIEVYDPAGDRDGTARLRRIEELREALQRGELEVHLQPQVDLRSGEITGAEALARWRHPEDGVLLPDSFLPLAEQTGLMRPVATLVLDRALTACATWWVRGYQVPVSVNLAAEDLRDPALPGQVSQALKEYGLPPAALRVEITEQALLTDPTSASAVLERWRTDGIRVAIDDFGTGYSSLSYLRELPVDEVKLDRAFVADIRRGTTSTIVRHTVAMAHGLWARVVAEGIEDEETAHSLAELGCDVGQGLYFGAAMTAPAFLELLERSASPAPEDSARTG